MTGKKWYTKPEVQSFPNQKHLEKVITVLCLQIRMGINSMYFTCNKYLYSPARRGEWQQKKLPKGNKAKLKLLFSLPVGGNGNKKNCQKEIRQNSAVCYPCP